MTENEKAEDGDKSRLRKALKQLRKDKEEEKGAARELLEEMQQNVNEAQERASESERSLCWELEDYLYSWEREIGRPNNLSAKILQMMQSNKYEVGRPRKRFRINSGENAPTGVERNGGSNQSLGRKER